MFLLVFLLLCFCPRSLSQSLPLFIFFVCELNWLESNPHSIRLPYTASAWIIDNAGIPDKLARHSSHRSEIYLVLSIFCRVSYRTTQKARRCFSGIAFSWPWGLITLSHQTWFIYMRNSNHNWEQVFTDLVEQFIRFFKLWSSIIAIFQKNNVSLYSFK